MKYLKLFDKLSACITSTEIFIYMDGKPSKQGLVSANQKQIDRILENGVPITREEFEEGFPDNDILDIMNKAFYLLAIDKELSNLKTS